MTKLKKERLLREMTQSELSQKSGVSRATIDRIENGRKEPKLKTLRQLADALECKIEEIIED